MIPFKQYLRPDGRARMVEVQADDATEEKAARLLSKGYRFEAEILATGDCSFEVVRDIPNPDIGDSLGIEICPNGPEVPEAIKKLIDGATEFLK